MTQQQRGTHYYEVRGSLFSIFVYLKSVECSCNQLPESVFSRTSFYSFYSCKSLGVYVYQLCTSDWIESFFEQSRPQLGPSSIWTCFKLTHHSLGYCFVDCSQLFWQKVSFHLILKASVVFFKFSSMSALYFDPFNILSNLPSFSITAEEKHFPQHDATTMFYSWNSLFTAQLFSFM